MIDHPAPLMELRGIRKYFEHRGNHLDVLHDLDLRIFPGDRISIIGPSGAGKSTLLHLMGTLDRPSAGTIRFGDEEILLRKDSDLAKFRNKEIGFIFQFHHLLPEFTALENTMLPGLIGRRSKADCQRRAEELLDSVGLMDRLHHQPGELSGGEQQRVAIARALFMEPKLLLADELTGNLDHKTGAETHGLLIALNERTGITIVVVTHDPRLAEEMAIRLRVEDGRLVAVGEADAEVKSRLEFS
jgi:lipoprotein-releasing system ATP-binding protein